MMLQAVELLGLYRRLRFAALLAHHFKINKSSVRTIVKKRKDKEIHEAVTAASPADMKTSTLCEIHFYVISKIQFFCGGRIAIRRHTYRLSD